MFCYVTVEKHSKYVSIELLRRIRIWRVFSNRNAYLAARHWCLHRSYQILESEWIDFVISVAAMRFQCLVVLLLSGAPICHSCLLCPLRLPPRPRPIDHFQLPSPDRMTTPESATELCEATKRLHVSDECRKGVTKIFCSLADLIDAKSSDCNTAEDKQRCVECSHRNAKIVNENFWIITCK